MSSPIFFWIAWIIVTSWVLHSFYFSRDKEKLNRLCKIVFWIDLSVLILFFFPWLPLSLGGASGWELIKNSNLSVSLLGIIILISTFLFLTQNKALLKIGVILQMSASVLFIGTMITLMPGTIILTLRSISSIISSLILLVGNIFALLLWNQLERSKKQ